jgi:guanylate kinase
VTYNFVTDEVFDALIAQDDFIEYARVHQKYRYGTRKSLVDVAMQSGCNVIKNLEIFGREQIVAKPEIKEYCYSIFMDIPDDEIVRRIVERDPRTTRDEIERRLASTNYEREQSKLLCDHYVDVFGMNRGEQYDYILNLIDQVTKK